MRTQTELENERSWVGTATIALLIAYLLVAVAYGYYSLVEMVAKNGWPLANLIAIFMILACIMPGIILWKVLRPHSKYAAIFGLLLAAALCVIPQILK